MQVPNDFKWFILSLSNTYSIEGTIIDARLINTYFLNKEGILLRFCRFLKLQIMNIMRNENMYQKNKTPLTSILIFLIQYAVHVPTLNAWLLKEITKFLMIYLFVWGAITIILGPSGYVHLYNSGGNHWPTFIMLKATIGSLCWVSGIWTLVRKYLTMGSCFLCLKVDHG